MYDVAFSPDGEQVASVAWDGTARLWNPTTGAEIDRLKHPQPYVTSLAFTRNGRTLATTNTGYGAILWDLTTRQPHLAVPLTWHARVALSPDDKILACNDFVEHRIILYDTAAKRQFATLGNVPPETSEVRPNIEDPVFSPDGTTLVISGDRVVLWDTATWKARRTPFRTWLAAATALPLAPRRPTAGRRCPRRQHIAFVDVRTRRTACEYRPGKSDSGTGF